MDFELSDEGEELFDNFIGSPFVPFPCFFTDFPKRGKSYLIILWEVCLFLSLVVLNIFCGGGRAL